MKHFCRRTITKNGNSLTIALPRVVLFNLGLMRGNELDFVYDDEARTITITKPDQQPSPALRVRSSRIMREVRA